MNSVLVVVVVALFANAFAETSTGSTITDTEPTTTPHGMTHSGQKNHSTTHVQNDQPQIATSTVVPTRVPSVSTSTAGLERKNATAQNAQKPGSDARAGNEAAASGGETGEMKSGGDRGRCEVAMVALMVMWLVAGCTA